MTAHVFRIDERSIIKGGWGDYAHILQHGMACHSPRVGGRLALERTGPYIPPITFPGIGEIVLTSEARRLLESSGLAGYGFLPVAKVLTVELHWEEWDLSLEEPPYFPESDEPEDYILGHPDSPSASAALGDLWEVVVPATATILRSKPLVDSYKDLRLDLGSWNGMDLFRSDGYGSVLFSERARRWFSETWGEYVEFFEFPTT